MARDTAPPPHDDALRAEHDALARRLAVRASIDEARRAAWALFALLISGGLAAKLAWDHWGSVRPEAAERQPVYFYAAAACAAVFLAVALRAVAAARRLMREEDSAYARLRALRERLGLGP